MINQSIEVYPTFKIFITSTNNYYFINAVPIESQSDPASIIELVYNRVSDILSTSSCEIVLERCYGNLEYYKNIIDTRNRIFKRNNIDINTPITYIEGKSCIGNPFSGIQIMAYKPSSNIKVETITKDNKSVGRTWIHNNCKFITLQNVGGIDFDSSSKKQLDILNQPRAMFHEAEKLLQLAGATYKDVVRTWIYLSKILDWYNDFNKIRNECYSEYNFLKNVDKEKMEQLYLPASTGIEGNNIMGLPALMNVFAIKRSADSPVNIRPLYGTKQCSPFRYGSAFSRAIVIEDASSKIIFVSGTASIDEAGKSLFHKDIENQIKHTMNVVSSLLAIENASLNNICEATVYLKWKEYFPAFQRIIKDIGIPNLPSVNVIADICRDELLFEIDATVILES